MKRNLKIYRDNNDWWVGWYRGPNHHYVILIPTIVIRWEKTLSNDKVLAQRNALVKK